jgi:drug/metabolite transporter, DME family
MMAFGWNGSSEERRGYVELVLYSVLAGAVGVFVKMVQGLDVFTIVFFRASIAASFILLLVAFRRRLVELRPVSPGRTLLVGLFQGLAIYLYFQALFQTSVSNAVFLLYTAPIFSVVFARLLFKEEIEAGTLMGVAVTLAGIVCVLNPSTFSFSSRETTGDLIALAAGFFYSVMAMTAKPLMKRASGYYAAFWQYAVISAIFLSFARFDSVNAVATNWPELLVIGVFCTGIAFILFMDGIGKVKAQKIFVVTALEPLMGTLLALAVLKEVPSPIAVLGAALILYGVYWTTRK